VEGFACLIADHGSSQIDPNDRTIFLHESLLQSKGRYFTSEKLLGELADSVITVSSADQTPLHTESDVIGTVVDSGRVQNLPLNARNFLQLGLLAGGAVDISPSNDNVGANVGHPDRMIVLPRTLPYSVGYFLNAWNHTQFEEPDGNAGAGVNFGRISATGPPRLIQVALKLLW
jgi:ankyrin repeat protein